MLSTTKFCHGVPPLCVNVYAFWTAWEQLHDPVFLHFCSGLAEVPLGHEAPMKRPDDPVLQPLDVQRNIPVEPRAERRHVSLILHEAVDGLSAQLADKVHCGLEVEAAEFHEDHDHL